MTKKIERILVAVNNGKTFADMILDYLPMGWDNYYSLCVLETGSDLKLELEGVKHGNPTNVAAVIVDSSEFFEKNHIIGQYVAKLDTQFFLYGKKKEFRDIPDPAENVTYLDRARSYDMVGKISDTLMGAREKQAKVLREADSKTKNLNTDSDSE